MAILMTSNQLIDKLQDIVDNYDTVYAYAVFGSPLTASLIQKKSVQAGCRDFYSTSKINELNKRIGAFGFDCVNLVKGILWGWNGDKSKTNGGAVYATNGVPDTNANGMFSNYCTSQSSDFSNILPGEALWVSGHFGVYIGNGKAIECTPSWKNKVQVTAVGNIGNISGLPTRKWTKHGKLPWIDYSNAATVSTAVSAAISDNDTVKIKSDAVYGGLSSTKGKAVPAQYIGKKYTVKKTQTNNGVKEALLQEINSGVAMKDLEKA